MTAGASDGLQSAGRGSKMSSCTLYSSGLDWIGLDWAVLDLVEDVHLIKIGKLLNNIPDSRL